MRATLKVALNLVVAKLQIVNMLNLIAAKNSNFTVFIVLPNVCSYSYICIHIYEI